MKNMPMHHTLINILGILLIALALAVAGQGVAQAQTHSLVQPWGLPPCRRGLDTVEKFADVSNTPQGRFPRRRRVR